MNELRYRTPGVDVSPFGTIELEVSPHRMETWGHLERCVRCLAPQDQLEVTHGLFDAATLRGHARLRCKACGLTGLLVWDGPTTVYFTPLPSAPATSELHATVMKSVREFERLRLDHVSDARADLSVLVDELRRSGARAPAGTLVMAIRALGSLRDSTFLTEREADVVAVGNGAATAQPVDTAMNDALQGQLDILRDENAELRSVLTRIDLLARDAEAVSLRRELAWRTKHPLGRAPDASDRDALHEIGELADSVIDADFLNGSDSFDLSCKSCGQVIGWAMTMIDDAVCGLCAQKPVVVPPAAGAPPIAAGSAIDPRVTAAVEARVRGSEGGGA